MAPPPEGNGRDAMKRLFAATTACALILAAPAFSEGQGRAMLLGTPQSAATALQGQGLHVTLDSSLSTADLRRALSALYAEKGDGPLIIVLNGNFVHGGGETWLMGSEAADQSTPPDLATVGGMGVNLDTVMAIAATRPGKALVLLGQADANADLGPGLEKGIGTLNVPQGVTVMQGPAAKVSDFAGGALEPGRSLAALASAHPELAAKGFLAPKMPFLAANAPSAVPAPPPAPTDTTGADDAAWSVAAQADTPEAYQAYLSKYPDGAHAADAKAAIAQILSEPNRDARNAEKSLSLTRDQRRQIQRDLSLLGHDPKGIDGIFGPGTRSAVKAWQGDEGGVKATGYLTASQIAKLNSQAEVRQTQLQAEADRRKAEQDKKDRAYWDATGSKGDRAGLKSYLDRYPDGIYADVAQARLDKLDAADQAKAQKDDRQAWRKAKDEDTVHAYRRYLRDNPDGAFVDAAHARIRRLNGDGGSSDAEKAAQQAEDALNLTSFTRNLVEKRLAGLGFDPGQVDGNFDHQTRRALRRFQRASNLPPTGYLNQQTLVRLVAGVKQ